MLADIAACVATLRPAGKVGIVGYCLGALLTPTLVVIYRFGRRRSMQNPFFIPQRGLERLVMLLLTAGILVGAVNAWFVATELAKQ